MSTSEQQQQKIIFLKYDDEDEQYVHHEESTKQSPIDLQNQPELSVSLKTYFETYDAFHIYEKFVVIRINGTNTLVIVEYPLQSKPLHVHIIEDLCHYHDGNQLHGHTIFVIFNDHILRIHLENEDEEPDISSFKECKTDFSFRISETGSSSFTMIEDDENEDDENEYLRACLILNELCWKKVELFKICLFPDDECLFSKIDEYFFRLPQNITGIQIYNFSTNYFQLYLTIDSEGILTNHLLEIPNTTDSIDESDGVFDQIIILTYFEKTIFVKIDDVNNLNRFQMMGFRTAAKIYGLEDIPHVNDLLELNKYVQNHQDDSDYGSDSD